MVYKITYLLSPVGHLVIDVVHVVRIDFTIIGNFLRLTIAIHGICSDNSRSLQIHWFLFTFVYLLFGQRDLYFPQLVQRFGRFIFRLLSDAISEKKETSLSLSLRKNGAGKRSIIYEPNHFISTVSGTLNN